MQSCDLCRALLFRSFSEKSRSTKPERSYYPTLAATLYARRGARWWRLMIFAACSTSNIPVNS